MTKKELKSIANTLSDIFISHPEEFIKQFEKIIPADISVHDGYVIGRLMDVYREAKTGGIDTKTAMSEQKRLLGGIII